ncbi:MAG: glycogen synthase [Calditrichaeota bacterium]|nr:glycogen synthase [Calditrichota bacterium]
MRILHIASEVAPFSKSGGLADVCSSLPLALGDLGHEVVVFSPRYGALREFNPRSETSETSITLNNQTFSIKFLEQNSDVSGVRFMFVECPELFERNGYYYDPLTNSDFTDNDARFAVFVCAALTWCKENDWIPQVVHGHDWQAGGAPLFMRSPRFEHAFDSSRFVFTIHNMAFQGRFHSGSRVWFDHAEDLADIGGPAEFHGMFNLLKLAIELADAINTVSPTYAHELRTVENMSFGLGPLLHKRHGHFFGILNGLDTTVWNPETDEHLPVQFNSTTLALRNRNKRALCERLELEYDKSIPLVGMVTRISEQKGFGALLPTVGELISEPAQLVVLGSGDPHFEDQLKLMEKTYPQRVRLVTEYNEPLAHLIYGGSDIFLMPSLFEPCGLSQMMALRYGAPPVARDTGGLSDTISDVSHDPNSGTGFLFREYSSQALSAAINRAFGMFHSTMRWRQMQRRGMKGDFSWRRSAHVYEEMYKRTLNNPRVVA